MLSNCALQSSDPISTFGISPLNCYQNLDKNYNHAGCTAHGGWDVCQVLSVLAQARSPRSLRASWRSLGIIMTRLA